MKKQDEIDFFWYLIESEVSEYPGCTHLGSDKIKLFNMHNKRKVYLLENGSVRIYGIAVVLCILVGLKRTQYKILLEIKE